MRLIPVCLSLVLAPVIAAGQQQQAAATQKPAQTSTDKQSTSTATHKTAVKHRARHHARRASARKSKKRAGLCPDSQFSATVISGAEVHNVCLDKSPSADRAKAKPNQMKVQVINGSTAGTQVFSNKNQETAHNQSVVVGVQSSDTRIAGGNKNPVVTGVTSSSKVDARTTSTGGQPVASQVSPRPKRPPYAPDQH